jgi:hypothetical protein
MICSLADRKTADWYQADRASMLCYHWMMCRILVDMHHMLVVDWYHSVLYQLDIVSIGFVPY